MKLSPHSLIPDPELVQLIHNLLGSVIRTMNERRSLKRVERRTKWSLLLQDKETLQHSCLLRKRLFVGNVDQK